MVPPTAHRETVLLVPNIHCPSCIAFIDNLLAQLNPAPYSVAISILAHTVTVRHNPDFDVRRIIGTLHEAGYEVDTHDVPIGNDWTDTIAGSDGNILPEVFGHRNPPYHALDEGTKRKRHQLHCKSCRTEVHGTDSRVKEKYEKGNIGDRMTAIGTASSAPDGRFLASLSITGMTCDSCISNVAAAFDVFPWVASVNASLRTQSADIEYSGEPNDVEHLVQVIDDLGYQAAVEKVTELPMEVVVSSHESDEIWEGSYTIEGMTCSSCVRAITEAVQGVNGVRNVEVNLVSHSARVCAYGKDTLDSVNNAIEDAGYGASLGDSKPVSSEVPASGDRRTVLIKIDGMYCHHCEATVATALGRLNGRVTIEKPATLDRPIATISYTPQAPSFTIRAIINAISNGDPAFKASIYHAPTLEERARLMHARIRRHILYRLLLSVIVAIPTFIIGVVYMALLPAGNPGRQYLMRPLHGASRAEWALLVLATPVYFFAADHFHRHMLKELYFLWKPGSQVPLFRRFYRFGSMDMLISLGTTIAYFSSIAQLGIAAGLRANHAAMIQPTADATYFDSVVFLTMFLLSGRLIEAYSKAKAGDAVSALQNLRPREALLVLPDEKREPGTETRTVNVDMIDLGDIVRVLHGSTPPWDGAILSEAALFDEASLTGESRPVNKVTGDIVYQGTINKGGPILVRVTKVSGDSMLDQIIKVVREGQARRAPIEKVADVLTSYFVPVIILIAVFTWVIWLTLGLSGTLPKSYLDTEVGGWAFWSLQFAIAVYIIACPCGIGLAAPTALFVGGGLAAKHGILAKGGGEAFQEASRLDIVVFDKTGTLTEGGDPKVTGQRFLLNGNGPCDEAQILAALCSVEENSSHPIAKAIVSACQSTTSVKAIAQHIEEVPGKGMSGTFRSDNLASEFDLLVGNESLIIERGVTLTSDILALLNHWSTEAQSIVIVALRAVTDSEPSRWEPAMILAISDVVRVESHFVIQSLSQQGIDVWMLSGDNPTTACAVGNTVGIPKERIIAGVLPHEKADKIRYLQRSQVATRSRRFLGLGNFSSSHKAIVAMIGDGVNDSVALTAADVGIAMGSGSDVAISSADFVLVNHDLMTLLRLVNLSRVVFRRVKLNFAWALVYNLVALPIAAGVLYPVTSNGNHVRLSPVWASLAMALSSISVICSSLLMRTKLPVLGFHAALFEEGSSG